MEERTEVVDQVGEDAAGEIESIEAADGKPQQAATAPPDGWREMKAAELSSLCKELGLPSSGTKAEQIKRLDLHFYGSSSRPLNGRVVCPYCKSHARRIGQKWMSERTLRRYYRCAGRRRHGFSIDTDMSEERQS